MNKFTNKYYKKKQEQQSLFVVCLTLHSAVERNANVNVLFAISYEDVVLFIEMRNRRHGLHSPPPRFSDLVGRADGTETFEERFRRLEHVFHLTTDWIRPIGWFVARERHCNRSSIVRSRLLSEL